MLQERRAERMLIAGVDPSVTRADLARRLGPGSRATLRCCVDLGSESVDTRSNAEEARRWMAKAMEIAEAGEALLAPVRRHLPDFTWPYLLARTRVERAATGADAGILGAAAAALGSSTWR